MKHWKEMISTTEELLKQWKHSSETTPYYDQIYKSWEHFIEKQKEELNYFTRTYQSSD